MGISIGSAQDVGRQSLATGNGTLFVFDVRTRKVDYTLPVELNGFAYNSVAMGPDGHVWGLAKKGIFRFDPQTRRVELAVQTPEPVAAGFALLNGSIYYGSGATVYRYHIPGAPSDRP